MQLNAKTHSNFRASWKRFAARDVVVTVHGPGDISIDYVDGCDGQPRGRSAQTLAHVEVLAMQWIDWTLVLPCGARSTRTGWLHANHDGESCVARDAVEQAIRRRNSDEHPRARELAWRVYTTSLEYTSRFVDTPMVKPTCVRPTLDEIEAAPL